jgi:hypothetical protein
MRLFLGSMVNMRDTRLEQCFEAVIESIDVVKTSFRTWTRLRFKIAGCVPFEVCLRSRPSKLISTVHFIFVKRAATQWPLEPKLSLYLGDRLWCSQIRPSSHCRNCHTPRTTSIIQTNGKSSGESLETWLSYPASKHLVGNAFANLWQSSSAPWS